MNRVIAHADMDAFYASVEQLDNPELRGKPLIVGGSSRRGVVTSASYEARKFGVRAAMPTAQARSLCPGAIFVPGRMERYVELSRLIQRIFRGFTPLVEPLSLDEAFLDLTGTERLLGPPLEVARLLKERVRQESGLVVSVGIAPTKMVAKILSDLSKPDGLLMIGAELVAGFLAPLPVERLWGVGRVTLARLQDAGIKTIGDLTRRDQASLHGRFGQLGVHLQQLALGNDSRLVTENERKSYGEENTFEQDLALDSTDLKRTVIAHSEALARRLRADHVLARTVTLKLKLARPLGQGRYPQLTRSFSPSRPTDDGNAIGRIALDLLAKVKERDKVRLLGVAVHNLARTDGDQLGLFAPASAPRDSKRDRLNSALDELTKRFGEDAVSRGKIQVERAAPTRRMK